MKGLIVFFVLLSANIQAEVVVIENYKFYIVDSEEINGLLPTLSKRSPIRQKGNVFHGQTEYDLNLRFWWREKNSQCGLTNVKTNLKLRYTMPKLKASNEKVLDVWSKWYPNLYVHEKGHADIAKKVAFDIDQKILSIKPKETCSVLKKQAYAIAKEMISDLERINKEYDLKTNHGETQGAWVYSYL